MDKKVIKRRPLSLHLFLYFPFLSFGSTLEFSRCTSSSSLRLYDGKKVFLPPTVEG